MVKQAYKRMTRLCSRGEYCVFDIRQKLRGMELSEEGEEAVVQKLKRIISLTRRVNTRGFISDKLRFNRWGRKKIELALHQSNSPGRLSSRRSWISQRRSYRLSSRPVEEKVAHCYRGFRVRERGEADSLCLGRGSAWRRSGAAWNR